MMQEGSYNRMGSGIKPTTSKPEYPPNQTKSETKPLPTGEFHPFPKTKANVPMPEIKPAKNNTEESCNHKWIHLDSTGSFRYNDAACRREYFQIDRFYCENCCEIKEIKQFR